ncbi:unnamed protein product [Caenorhabditis auriculariae]|uniref:Ras-associating domain-containing protein n=1 Tax=Caenorhabditis auriculariae TaxID=2777116 RepID=A0A8S1GQT8_9PELO|nr:unnamed protein product [Caenorhabditis auriculariae]
MAAMELKVLVEGVERSVSGVTMNTTCSQIIYALANATCQRGRFVLVEKFRTVERRMAPNDKPLQNLRMLRDHGANVTFIMKKIERDGSDSPSPKHPEYLTSMSAGSSVRHSSVHRASSVENGQAAVTVDAGQRSQGTSASSYSSGTLPRNRPPPPDYNSVMQKKQAGATRRTVLSDSMFQYDYISLIDSRGEFTEKYKANEARRLAEEECAAAEEELRQIIKQQINLRAILTPMISANWPQIYLQEINRSHKIGASVEATREALDKTRSDLQRILETEKDLLSQISLMDEEEVLETSLDLNTSNSSTPQKLAV